MKLKGRTILITGAGTGMGLTASQMLAQRGNRIIMVARNAERLKKAASKLPNAEPFACDIADQEEVSRLIDWIGQHAPDLDTLFLNAGVTHTYRLFDGTDAVSSAREEMEVNFVATVDLTHRFLPILAARPDPAMIITTSGVVYAPDTTNPTYSATKAALHAYILAMRFQLTQNQSPVRVFEFVAPLVDTPFSAGVKSDAKKSPEAAINGLLAGLERDDADIRDDITQELYEVWRRDQDKAMAMVNDLTGA
jgi:uncharacterized oxidoreductase